MGWCAYIYAEIVSLQQRNDKCLKILKININQGGLQHWEITLVPKLYKKFLH